MELIEKILSLYLSFIDVINLHFYKFSIAFTLISIFWIAFIGIVTPLLIISVMAFGYYGIVVTLISIILASIINFFMVIKTKSIIKKIKNKKPIISKEPFLMFIIFRMIPGIPYLIKNLSVFFFKLNLKKFLLAVVIADTPQIIIFTFFFKRLIDSSNQFIITKDFNDIFEQMYLPTLILGFFMLVILFLKKKKSIFYKK